MSQFPVVHTISKEALKTGLSNGSIVAVDVREAHEYAAGHIGGAQLNPLSTFDVAALPVQSAAKIVLYCRSGRRSVTALGLAQAGGRTDIDTHFEGGMLEWAGSGEPVTR